jgi:hypothetical protein
MSVMDIIIALLLAVGLAFSLPIWWWLFVGPLVRLCKHVGRGTRTLLFRLKQHRSRP